MKKYADPQEIYRQRKIEYTDLLHRQLRLFNLLSNLRILIFVVGLGAVLFLAYIQQFSLSGLILVVSFVLFLFLIVKHEKVRLVKDRTSHLIKINEKGLARLDGNWTEFADDGSEFIDHDHPFTRDFDIFGQASLFQWINSTHTYFGRKGLARELARPYKNADKIRRRQVAVQELAEKLDWRQTFEAEGMFAFQKTSSPEWLIKWIQEPNQVLQKRGLLFLIRVLPVVTIVSLLMAWIIPQVPYSLPLLFIGFQLGMNYFGSKGFMRIFDSARYYKDALKAYEASVKLIEEEPFQAQLLIDLQVGLFDEKGRLASTQIRRLAKIVDLMDLRFNGFFYFLINNLVLWDFQCMVRLERWKERSGKSLFKWLDAVGRVESLASLAVIHFEHPEWVFPELVKGKYVFVAKEMGHPLLPDQIRVDNDLNLQGSGTIFIITGSNMSGKSTFLRTIGINLVLTYLGAPACAADLKCSIMEMYSSMRVNDNLEKNISSFYAELLRVKMIVEASRKGVPMIFFVDEIFSGTNTRDRHIGAKNVMKSLSRAGVMGLVSTHDLELGELERERNLHIRNYHFSEGYEGNRIQFTYKLHPGVSTTSNAIYLMRMVGIEVMEEE